MADVLQFDEETSRTLEIAYAAPEVVAQRRSVIQALQLHAGEAVLDIGCGPGYLVADMAAAVTPAGRVTGVDRSESALALARQRCAGLASVEFRSAEATRLPFLDSSFDAIVVTQVYEYVADLSAALSELYRVLRPRGRAVIIDTDWRTLVWHSSDPARMQRILQAWDAHLVNPVLPRTLAVQLRQAGLVVRQQSVIPYLNTQYNSNFYSYGLAKFICSFVPGRQDIAKEEVAAWAAEFPALSDSGAYFFSLNRYLFLAEKS